MSQSLDQLLTPTRVAHGVYTTEIPDGWQQGRGAYGGLVLGVMTRAMMDAVGDPARKLRSLTAEIVGPTQVGAAEIHVFAVRIGNAVSTLRAELRQGNEIQAHVVGVFGADRAPDVGWNMLVPPTIPDWRGVAPLDLPVGLAPVFTGNLEFRSTGNLPFSGAAEPTVSGFIRPIVPAVNRDSAYIIAMADAWWLCGFTMVTMPRPAATITFTLSLHDGAAQVGDAEAVAQQTPLYHRAWSPTVTGGYAAEVRELWTLDGKLVSINTQTIAIIK